jgi:hypothetical protein
MASPTTPQWRKLDLALVISTEPHLLIDDPFRSPFNVAYTIHIDSLTLEEHRRLSRRYPDPLSDASVTLLHELLGGHPYLTRLAYYRIHVGGSQFQDVLDTASRQDGPFGDHLRAMLSKVSRDPQLLPALKKIIAGKEVPVGLAYRLESAGLVRSDGKRWNPTSVVYATFFQGIA